MKKNLHKQIVLFDNGNGFCPYHYYYASDKEQEIVFEDKKNTDETRNMKMAFDSPAITPSYGPRQKGKK